MFYFGEYRIAKSNTRPLYWKLYWNEQVIGEFSSLKEAKAAIQNN